MNDQILGFNIKTLEYKGWKLNCWDVGGQKSLRSYWRNYFERTDGVIWVVDSADIARLEDCAKELHGLLNEEVLRGTSVLILANKSDLKSAISTEEISQVGNFCFKNLFLKLKNFETRLKKWMKIKPQKVL